MTLEYTLDGDTGVVFTRRFAAPPADVFDAHVERMHLPDTTPDNRVVTTFEPDGNGTRMTMTMSVPTKEARDAMLASGMADGMEASFARLDGLAETAG